MQVIYKNLLFIAAVIIWSLMLAAKFAEYDTNYVYAFIALIASLLTTVLIIATWFIKKQIVKVSTVSAFLFFITSSPLSLFLFVYLYIEFIGQYFKS